MTLFEFIRGLFQKKREPNNTVQPATESKERFTPKVTVMPADFHPAQEPPEIPKRYLVDDVKPEPRPIKQEKEPEPIFPDKIELFPEGESLDGVTKYLVLDTETDGSANQIAIQISWILMDERGRVIDRANDYINDPDTDISPSAYKIHRLTTEFLQANGKSKEEIYNKLLSAISRSDALVAHNIPFDHYVLSRGFATLGISDPFLDKVNFCTYRLSKANASKGGYLFNLRNNELPSIAGSLLFNDPEKPFSNLHDSDFDTELTARCFVRMKQLEAEGIFELKPHNYKTEALKKFGLQHKLGMSEAKGYKFLSEEKLKETGLKGLIDGKTVLISGDLRDYDMDMTRENVKNIIVSMGGKCASSVTSKVDIIILGEGFGESKKKKIDEFIEKGKSFTFIEGEIFVDVYLESIKK